MPTATQITDPVATHGEGPVWDVAGAQLLSVDMLAGALVRLDPATGELARHDVADVLACVRPRSAGGAVVLAERRFALLDAVPTGFGTIFDTRPVTRSVAGSGTGPGSDTGPGTTPDADPLRLASTMLPPLWERGSVRFNEGGCDPAGRFYGGSMAYDESAGGGDLWCLEPDGSARVVLPGVSVSNGIAFTAPDRALYVDSPTRAVQVLTTDPATGDVTDVRVLTTLPDSLDGVPDGLVLDTGGGAWVAVNGAGCVIHLDAAGAVDERVDVPVAQVTACTFGGPGMGTLFITTSSMGLPDDEVGAAGSIFAHEPGVSGAPALPFGG